MPSRDKFSLDRRACWHPLHPKGNATNIIAKLLWAELIVVTMKWRFFNRVLKKTIMLKVDEKEDVRHTSCGLKPGLKQLLRKPWCCSEYIYFSAHTKHSTAPEIWSLHSCRYMAEPHHFSFEPWFNFALHPILSALPDQSNTPRDILPGDMYWLGTAPGRIKKTHDWPFPDGRLYGGKMHIMQERHYTRMLRRMPQWSGIYLANPTAIPGFIDPLDPSALWPYPKCLGRFIQICSWS